MDLFCDVTIPSYQQKDCGIDFAGIVGVGLIDEDYTFTDIELPAEWAAAIGASPPDAYVLKKTRGEYSGGQEVEEEGFGLSSVRVTGADHELTFEVEGIKENVGFWNGVNRKDWKIAFVDAGGQLTYISVPVSVYAKITQPRDIKTAKFWMVTVKWSSYDNPEVFTAPVGIFT